MHYYAVYKEEGTRPVLMKCAWKLGAIAQHEIAEEAYAALEDKFHRVEEAARAVLYAAADMEEVSGEIREEVRCEVIEQMAGMVYVGGELGSEWDDLREDVLAAAEKLVTERGEYVPETNEAQEALDEAFTVLYGEEAPR